MSEPLFPNPTDYDIGAPRLAMRISLMRKVCEGVEGFQWRGNDGQCYSPLFFDGEEALQYMQEKLPKFDVGELPNIQPRQFPKAL